MKDIPCVDSCLFRLGSLCLMYNASFMLTSKSLLAESMTMKLLHESYQYTVGIGVYTFIGHKPAGL